MWPQCENPYTVGNVFFCIFNIVFSYYTFFPMFSFFQVFGYLNMFVWAGNAWFVYKETRWHSQKFSTQSGPARQQVPAPI